MLPQCHPSSKSSLVKWTTVSLFQGNLPMPSVACGMFPDLFIRDCEGLPLAIPYRDVDEQEERSSNLLYAI